MSFPIYSFLLAYFLTNALEFIPFLLLIKKPLKEKVLKLILINTITLPIVWIIFPVFPADFGTAFIVIETLVILAETFLIMKLLKQQLLHAYKVAAIMNVLSALLGLILL